MTNSVAGTKARLSNELSVRRRQAHELEQGIKRRRTRLSAVRVRAKRVRAKLIRINRPKVKISGNHVVGGTPRERLLAAALRAVDLDARGVRRSFYSQSGDWRVDRGITGEPPGYRSDCSQWVTAIYWSAGLQDPNGTSYQYGYTGTLAAHGREIPRSKVKAGDLVIWDPEGPDGHVEMIIDPRTLETAGHGSAHVDKGHVLDFAYKPGGARYFTYL